MKKPKAETLESIFIQAEEEKVKKEEDFFFVEDKKNSTIES